MSARDELVEYLLHFGGRCRDCADENGVCPQTGIGCGERKKAIEYLLGALEYGTKHGFAAGYRIIGPGEVDSATLYAANSYMVDQYGIGALGHATDRARIAAALRSLTPSDGGRGG